MRHPIKIEKLRCECYEPRCKAEHNSNTQRCANDAKFVAERMDSLGECRLIVCEGCGMDMIESGNFDVQGAIDTERSWSSPETRAPF
jgi:hypothetical protein